MQYVETLQLRVFFILTLVSSFKFQVIFELLHPCPNQVYRGEERKEKK